jgi:hypothetical protein
MIKTPFVLIVILILNIYILNKFNELVLGTCMETGNRKSAAATTTADRD